MDSKLFLTNTDTTIGFISKDAKALDIAKDRASNKGYIKALSSLKLVKKRVPKKYRKVVRRAKKTTFVLSKDYSFRVIRESSHLLLIKRLKEAYTTSANRSGEEFNLEYAKSKADVIIYPLNRLDNPSKIYKLTKSKIERLR